MVSSVKPMPGLMTKALPAWPCSCRDAERLHDGEDRQVAGPLGDLAPAQFAFLLQLFERRDHHGQQLQNDRRRDVRHDAQGENRQPADVAAANMSKKPKMEPDCELKKVLPALTLMPGVGMWPPSRYTASMASVNNTACAGPGRGRCWRTLQKLHGSFDSRRVATSPLPRRSPAPSAGLLNLFRADFEKMCASTVIFLVNWPVPSTFSPSPSFLITPSSIRLSA
jgi:hypothetical protein